MHLFSKKIFIYSGITLSLVSGGIVLNSGLTYLNAATVQADSNTNSQLVNLLDPTGLANTHLLASNFYLKNYQSNHYLSNESNSPAITNQPSADSQSLWTGNYITSGHYQLINNNNQQLLTGNGYSKIGFSETTDDKTVTDNQWELQSVPANEVNGQKNVYLIKNADTGHYLTQDGSQTSVISSANHNKSAYW